MKNYICLNNESRLFYGKTKFIHRAVEWYFEFTNLKRSPTDRSWNAKNSKPRGPRKSARNFSQMLLFTAGPLCYEIDTSLGHEIQDKARRNFPKRFPRNSFERFFAKREGDSGLRLSRSMGYSSHPAGGGREKRKRKSL